MNLSQYKAPSFEVSLYKDIPIQYFDAIKALLGPGYRYRWRGPRSTDGRTRYAQQSTCMKTNANRFSVYFR